MLTSLRPWVLAVLVALGVCASGAAFAEPAVTGVRMGLDQERTRFVLDLTEAVDAKVFVLTAPDRLVVDLPPVAWQVPDESKSGMGLVRGYRFGRYDEKISRLVLDLNGPAQVVRQFRLPPNSGYQHRYVIDLAPGAAAAPNIAENQPDTRATAEARIPAPQHKPRALTVTVFIDPGHGGIDPGTTGGDGSKEKEVVLQVGLKLKDVLEDKGYSVVMSRDSDVFYSLKERVAMARAAGADLFISLHADSNSDDDVRGASVYTLSDTASDEEAAELARKENRSDTIAGIDISEESEEVSSILIELTMRETMNQSARFARLLAPELGEVSPLLKNTHRFAGFRVLKAPDIPSVLVELGQLSNSADEDRLTAKRTQTKLANAIARAVDDFFRVDQRAELR